MAGIAERLSPSEGLTRGRSDTVARMNVLGFRTWPIARQFLFVLVAIFLVKQAINVFIFPPFSGHDEVAHYAYVRTVATDYRVPKIPILSEFRDALQTRRDQLPGDYLPDDGYPSCRYVLDWGSCNEPRWANDPPHISALQGEYFPYGWQYAANHPPLYYLLMAPIYKSTESASPTTQLYLMRAASIPFGLAVVLLAYAMVRTLFPRDQFLGITVPAFVAFQPQVSYEGAMLNNDIASIAVFSLVLYLLVVGLKRGFSYRLTAAIGLTVGVGLLFKSTTLMLLPLVALALILGVGLKNILGWVRRGALVAGIAALVAWPWYLFLYQTYGNFSALDQIADNQYALTYPGQNKPTILDLFWNADFAAFRWHETWGEFGWRLIQYDNTFLWAIGIPCIVATVGLLGYLGAIAVSWRPNEPRGGGFAGVRSLESWQVASIGVILLAGLIAYAAMLEFGTRFSLTQARYFFPAINAYALLLMLGLRAILPEGWRRYGQAAVVAALILLNVLIYTQYVIPYWYLGS
jgi:4-amino-4-deoxy-L-arabinose transferase-like glycosyltransferase